MVITWGGLTKNGSYTAFGVVRTLTGVNPIFLGGGHKPSLWMLEIDVWERGWRHQEGKRTVAVWEVQPCRLPLTEHMVAVPGLDREELAARFPPGALHRSEVADKRNYSSREWEDDTP